MPVPFTRKTLAELRQQVGYLVLGRARFKTGAATAGTATSVTVPSIAQFPSDTFQGRPVYIASGTGVGQVRGCTASTQGTGELTVSPSWSVTPDATSTVEIWYGDLLPDEVKAALNRVILEVGPNYPVYTELTTGTLDTNRLIYTLPGTLSHVCGFRYQDAGNMWVHVYPHSWGDPMYGPNYQLLGSTLVLSEAVPSAAASITVCGYRLPAELSSDSDLAELPATVLVYMAAAQLEATDAEGPQLDPSQHGGRAANWIKLAQDDLMRINQQWRPNTQPVLA